MKIPSPLDSQKEKLKKRYMTIYDQLFSNCEKYLVVSNSFGQIGIFNVAKFLNSDEFADPDRYYPTFIFSAGGQDQPIFSLAQTDTFVMGGGIGSIQAWRWSDLRKKQTEVAWSIPLDKGAQFLQPEVNSLLVDSSKDNGTALYAACGDNAIHCYDLETRTLKCSFKEHTDPIYDITLSSSGTDLLSVSEDGALKIWDTRISNKSVHTIYPYQQENLSRPSLGKWVSCVDLDNSEEWIVCGGGPQVALWHLRSLSTSVTLPMGQVPATCAMFYNDGILTAGSEPALKQWDFGGALLTNIPTSPFCVFNLALSPSHSNKMVSVGGRGFKVDICTNLSYKDFTLRFDHPPPSP